MIFIIKTHVWGSVSGFFLFNNLLNENFDSFIFGKVESFKILYFEDLKERDFHLIKFHLISRKSVSFAQHPFKS